MKVRAEIIKPKPYDENTAVLEDFDALLKAQYAPHDNRNHPEVLIEDGREYINICPACETVVASYCCRERCPKCRNIISSCCD